MTTRSPLGHGGPRPKVRADDGRSRSGGARAGAGAKPKSYTLKLGQKLFVVTRDQDGNPVDGAQLWTVAAIDRLWLTIHSDNGCTIRVRR